MILIVTPGRLNKQAEFYSQLSALTSAGVGVLGALEHLYKHPPAWSFKRPIARMLEQLKEGNTFVEALRRSGEQIPDFDLSLLDAGEQSGRLDACFKLLSDYYQDRARLARQVISDLMYPLFVLHAAVFIMPFASFFLSTSPNALAIYLLQTFGILIPLYAGVFFLLYASQGRHGEQWRAGIEQFCRFIPILGSARRNLAIARLAAALEALINAGVPIFVAWEKSAEASGSPAILRAVRSWKPNLLNGRTPGEEVSDCREFPSIFSSQYATGEASGSIDHVLRRMHHYYHDEGTRQLRALANWTPKIVYFGIVIFVAIKIVSFYLGYFNQIKAVM